MNQYRYSIHTVSHIIYGSNDTWFPKACIQNHPTKMNRIENIIQEHSMEKSPDMKAIATSTSKPVAWCSC